MKDLELVLQFVKDRKSDCKRLEDISCFSDNFKLELKGMIEAYDSIINYIKFLLNLESENVDDKEPEDKKQNTFTKDGQEYLYLNKFSEVINPCYVNPKNCEDCSFYKEFLSQGKTYVGDIPCSWCHYSQVTCSTNTQGK